jgi:hypothetical protein
VLDSLRSSAEAVDSASFLGSSSESNLVSVTCWMPAHVRAPSRALLPTGTGSKVMNKTLQRFVVPLVRYHHDTKTLQRFVVPLVRYHHDTKTLQRFVVPLVRYHHDTIAVKHTLSRVRQPISAIPADQNLHGVGFRAHEQCRSLIICSRDVLFNSDKHSNMRQCVAFNTSVWASPQFPRKQQQQHQKQKQPAVALLFQPARPTVDDRPHRPRPSSCCQGLVAATHGHLEQPLKYRSGRCHCGSKKEQRGCGTDDGRKRTRKECLSRGVERGDI